MRDDPAKHPPQTEPSHPEDRSPSTIDLPRRPMTREELRSFAERYAAGEPISEWPAGIRDIELNWGEYRDGTMGLEGVIFYPENPQPGVVYDDYGQPDLEATESRRRREEMTRKLAASRTGASKGGKVGGDTRRDETAREDEALLAAVRAYRARNPTAGDTEIARVLFAKYGDVSAYADPAARKRGIDTFRTRIRRLEARAARGAAGSLRKSKPKRYEPPDLPDGRSWIYAYGYPPKPITLALERERLEMEYKLSRIHEGGTRGRLTTSERKREQAAQGREALLAAVEAYRKKHPEADLATIAKALLSTHGRKIDHADPEDEERAIQALTKRVRRAKKALDT